MNLLKFRLEAAIEDYQDSLNDVESSTSRNLTYSTHFSNETGSIKFYLIYMKIHIKLIRCSLPSNPAKYRKAGQSYVCLCGSIWHCQKDW